MACYLCDRSGRGTVVDRGRDISITCTSYVQIRKGGEVVTLDLSRGHRPVAAAVAPLDLSIAQETRKKGAHRRLGVHRAREPLAL